MKRYSVKEIAGMFINPASNKPITTGRVHQLIKEMREYVLDNIVIA